MQHNNEIMNITVELYNSVVVIYSHLEWHTHVCSDNSLKVLFCLVSAPDIIQEDSPTVVIATDDDELSMKRKWSFVFSKTSLKYRTVIDSDLRLHIYN